MSRRGCRRRNERTDETIVLRSSGRQSGAELPKGTVFGWLATNVFRCAGADDLQCFAGDRVFRVFRFVQPCSVGLNTVGVRLVRCCSMAFDGVGRRTMLAERRSAGLFGWLATNVFRCAGADDLQCFAGDRVFRVVQVCSALFGRGEHGGCSGGSMLFDCVRCRRSGDDAGRSSVGAGLKDGGRSSWTWRLLRCAA